MEWFKIILYLKAFIFLYIQNPSRLSMSKYLYIFLFFLSLCVNAQVQLCQGTRGNVVFHENFGNGVGIGSPLPNGSISYSFTTNFPEEGQYTVRSNTIPNPETLPNPNDWIWHLLPDDWSSTLNSVPGKMLLINARETPGTFYKKTIVNLCEETSYAFSFWAAPLYNINSEICEENNGLGAPINLKIEVWNADETQLIRSAETGDISNIDSINFQEYGVIFSTLSGQTSVVIKISNNNQQPGCGNDIALDELLVHVCGGSSSITSVVYEDTEAIFCDDQTPIDFQLKIENSNTENYFLLQKSENGTLWENVGEPVLSTGSNFIYNTSVSISSTSRYRVKFASTVNNLSNSISCVWYSNIYIVHVFSSTDAPISFSGDLEYCGEGTIPTLAVYPSTGRTVDWYDSPTEGTLLHSNSFNYTPEGPGTFYAQYSSTEIDCTGTVRTPITLTWLPGIMVSTNPPPYFICGGESIILDAEYPNAIYEWIPSSLSNGQTAVVSEPGLYTVTIRDPSNQCVEARTRTFIVNGYHNPEIANISHSGSTLTVTMLEEDYYEYSLDGIFWQSSNVFENISVGLMFVYVRDPLNCGLDMQEYLVLSPPLFFTPNGDGINDTFFITGTSRLDLTTYIFDRFGKLITVLNDRNPVWDGTYKGKKLPSNDYWYKITLDEKVVMKGHFALKR